MHINRADILLVLAPLLLSAILASSAVSEGAAESKGLATKSPSSFDPLSTAGPDGSFVQQPSSVGDSLPSDLLASLNAEDDDTLLIPEVVMSENLSSSNIGGDPSENLPPSQEPRAKRNNGNDHQNVLRGSRRPHLRGILRRNRSINNTRASQESGGPEDEKVKGLVVSKKRDRFNEDDVDEAVSKFPASAGTNLDSIFTTEFSSFNLPEPVRQRRKAPPQSKLPDYAFSSIDAVRVKEKRRKRNRNPLRRHLNHEAPSHWEAAGSRRRSGYDDDYYLLDDAEEWDYDYADEPPKRRRQQLSRSDNYYYDDGRDDEYYEDEFYELGGVGRGSGYSMADFKRDFSRTRFSKWDDDDGEDEWLDEDYDDDRWSFSTGPRRKQRKLSSNVRRRGNLGRLISHEQVEDEDYDWDYDYEDDEDYDDYIPVRRGGKPRQASQFVRVRLPQSSNDPRPDLYDDDHDPKPQRTTRRTGNLATRQRPSASYIKIPETKPSAAPQETDSESVRVQRVYRSQTQPLAPRGRVGLRGTGRQRTYLVRSNAGSGSSRGYQTRRRKRTTALVPVDEAIRSSIDPDQVEEEDDFLRRVYTHRRSNY